MTDISTAAVLFGLLPAGSLAVTLGARRAVNGLAPGTAFPITRIAAWGLIAGAFMAIVLIANATSYSLPSAFTITLSAIFMGIAAGVDRELAWAPDQIMVPLCILATLMGDILYGQYSADPIWKTILIGLSVFGTAQAAWIAQVKTGFRFAPPPDVIALCLPFAVFGASIWTVVYMITLSVLLAVCKRSAIARSIFSSQAALDDAEEDLQYQKAADEDGRTESQSITFLSVALPPLITIVAISTFFTVSW